MAKFLVVALLFAFNASAEDLRLRPAEPKEDRRAWTTANTAMQSLALTSIALDWNQTLRIGAACMETNMLLGKCPARRSIHIYFISYMVTDSIIAYALPDPWRSLFQSVTIIYQADVVRSNIRYGWRIRF